MRRLLDSADHGSHTRPRTGTSSSGYAALVLRWRWAVILGWGLLAASALALADPRTSSGQGVEGFVSTDTPAIRTELRSVERFGFPLLSRTMLVQRDPHGLPVLAQAEAIARAAAATQGGYPNASPIAGALPVPNTRGFFPGTRERDTSVLTLLFIPPGVSFADQYAAARDFAARHLSPADAFVGVTGSVPARVEQGRLLAEWLPLAEVATVAAVILIVALTFRSVVAPLLVLGAVGIAVLVMTPAVSVAGNVLGVPIPGELMPLMVALLIGVVTDYVIFYLSALRRRLAPGTGRKEAARRATVDFTSIIAVAGLTVAAGTATLVVADSRLFRAFGPGMALAVVVGLLVSVTLVPAVMAVLGRWLFWPSRPGVRGPDAEAAPSSPRRRPVILVVALTRPRTAALVLAGCTLGLATVAVPVRDLDLGVAFVSSLPEENEVRHSARAARQAFADGIMSPTTLLLEAPGITARRSQLDRLGDLLAREPGVAGVLGPGDQPLPTELGIVLAREGGAARYLVVLDSTPLDARAIDTFARLQHRMPRLLSDAGLDGVRAGFAGDTAIAHTVVRETTDDLGRIALAGLIVNLLLLVVFLRALVAPLYLLACSALALLATLGVTTAVFQGLLRQDGLTFYVPFAAAVLLLALGSDYNIFGVGHIWEQARRRPLPQAIVVAVPRTTRAITAAGITLATSFGMLAVVPLRPFRELAFALSVGILLDVVVVRSLMVPCLLTLVGRVSAWPGSALGTGAAVEPGTDEEPARRS